jgi:hypothetical protein
MSVSLPGSRSQSQSHALSQSPSPFPGVPAHAAPHPDPDSDPDLDLAPRHRAELEQGSAIDPAIIAERGYRSLTAADLPALLPAAFEGAQRRPGLLVPISSVHGTVGAWQIKPDQPRIINGKPVKYETARGASLCLDVPGRVRPLLGDPGVPLWITEGAKKVDAALSHGVRCVVGVQGVYGWRGTNGTGGKTALADWEMVALNGRDVVLAFDSDCMTKPQVRTALERLAAFLASRGATVGYCVMPDLPGGAKCGLDDFFAQGRSFDDLCGCIVEALPPLPPLPELPLAQAPASPGDPVEPHDASDEATAVAAAAVPVPDLLRISEAASETIAWLWPGWIPRRMLTILGGYGGDGKSTVMASLTGAWTTGGTLPDGSRAPRTNVLLLSAEDDVSYAIRPRLETHGADINRVFLLKGTRTSEGGSRWLDLRRDVAMMEQVIREHAIGLVVIDPLSSYLPKADRNSEGDIRDALQPLLGLMERTDVAIVGIMHVGKAADGRRASQRLLGSTAFTALARSVIMIADIPDDQQPDDVETQGKQKVLQVVKSNYAIAPPPRLFRRPLDAAIRWFGESGVGIDECFASANGGKRGQDRAEAELLLQEMLKGASVPVTEILAEAKKLGFSEVTMRRAKKSLGIEAVKIGYGKGWQWRFPLLPPLAGAAEGDHVPV